MISANISLGKNILCFRTMRKALGGFVGWRLMYKVSICFSCAGRVDNIGIRLQELTAMLEAAENIISFGGEIEILA